MPREQKPTIGTIPCPHCGETMNVKRDKNEDPFGHCEECAGQLRVGGNPARLRKFIAKYPWAAKPVVGAAGPVTVTETPKVPVPVTETPPPPPPKRRAGFADALDILGGRRAA